MRASKWFWIAVVVTALVFLVSAQEKPTVKQGPIQRVSQASGEKMFQSYCAVCHGTDGRGDGPAAAALKNPPADLTALAAKNGGKYPSMRVMSVIRGDSGYAAHGSKEMPVWGPLFRSISGGHDAEVGQRITNLTKYIETLQTK